MVKVLAVVLAIAGAIWFTAPADAAARKSDGIQNGQAVTMDLSARRYHRRYVYRYGPRYRYYGGPYYYGYPYGYYPYGYYPYYYRRPGIYFRFF
jgi:hypothetical protein